MKGDKTSMKTSGTRTNIYVCKEAFKCDKEMSRRLREQCEAEGIKKSQLIREAVAMRIAV